MLQRVCFRLLGSYRGVTFFPSGVGRAKGKPLIIREAAVPFRAQVRHAGAVFAFLLACLAAEIALRFSVVDSEPFRLGVDDGTPAREFFNCGAFDPGQPEAFAVLLYSIPEVPQFSRQTCMES